MSDSLCECTSPQSCSFPLEWRHMLRDTHQMKKHAQCAWLVHVSSGVCLFVMAAQVNVCNQQCQCLHFLASIDAHTFYHYLCMAAVPPARPVASPRFAQLQYGFIYALCIRVAAAIRTLLKTRLRRLCQVAVLGARTTARRR